MDTIAKAEAGDWRTKIAPEARIRITNKIMGTLKRSLPCSPDESNEYQNIAARFEETMFALAISQSDYLKKISLKMLSLESKTKHAPIVNPAVSNTIVTTEVENLLAILTIDDGATLPQET